MINSVVESITPRRVLRGFDLSLFGGFRDFWSMDHSVRSEIFTNGLPQGHFDFVGAHMALSTLKARFPAGRFMTLVRHPIDRLFSYFFYWRSLPDHEVEQWGRFAARVRLARGPIGDFISAKDVACQTDNVLTRLLLWPHPNIPDDDFVLPEHHDELHRAARERIKQFDFVDFVENPMLGQNISTWLNSAFRFRWDNDTPITSSGDFLPDLDETVHHQIRQLCAVDLRLWYSIAS